MIEIHDNLEKRVIFIDRDQFNNTITASIPNVFKPTINALIVVSIKTKTKLTSEELISTIRAEAQGHITKPMGKKEAANFAGNTRGRGGF